MTLKRFVAQYVSQSWCNKGLFGFLGLRVKYNRVWLRRSGLVVVVEFELEKGTRRTGWQGNYLTTFWWYKTMMIMIIAIVFIGLHWGFNIKSIVRPGAVHKWRHHGGAVEHSDCDILIMIILSNCSEEANAFYAMFGCLVLTRIIEYPSTDLFSCVTQLVVWIGFIPHLVRVTFKETSASVCQGCSPLS